MMAASTVFGFAFASLPQGTAAYYAKPAYYHQINVFVGDVASVLLVLLPFVQEVGSIVVDRLRRSHRQALICLKSTSQRIFICASPTGESITSVWPPPHRTFRTVAANFSPSMARPPATIELRSLLAASSSSTSRNRELCNKFIKISVFSPCKPVADAYRKSASWTMEMARR